jgi:hypothetical protein
MDARTIVAQEKAAPADVEYLRAGTYGIEYLDYDRSLNEQAPKAGAP